MPTVKRRITITLDAELDAVLSEAAAKAGSKSLSGYIVNMLGSIALPDRRYSIVKYGGKRSGAGQKKNKRGVIDD